MSLTEAQRQQVERAVALLRAGELVALPTETVYGLGADALNPEAVARIFAAKGRPADHPLIVHIADAAQLTTWAARVPKEAVALARAFWPGPLTLILPRSEEVPDLVTGGQPTVGLRVPNHPLALALLRAFGSGIAAPSANRFGRISPTTAEHVRADLGERVPLVLDGGACTVGIESTILDLSGPQAVILRPGGISAAAIAEVIGRRPMGREELSVPAVVPRVSGALAAHYAPRTAMRLVPGEQLQREIERAARLRVAVLARRAAFDFFVGAWHEAPRDAESYAHDLYASLRTLDQTGADLILVETPPDDDRWRAVADRLGRAAVGSGEADET